AFAELVTPNELAGFVVQRAQRGAGPEVLIAPAPAFHLAVDGAVVNAKKAVAVDVEEPGLRTVAGRHPVGGAVRTGCGKRAGRARIGLGIGNRPATLIDALGPGGFDEGRGDQVFAVGAIENEEESVAARLSKHFAGLSLEITIDQDRRLYGVPVMGVVWRRLKIPSECR